MNKSELVAAIADSTGESQAAVLLPRKSGRAPK
jgi:hypothetical protein